MKEIIHTYLQNMIETQLNKIVLNHKPFMSVNEVALYLDMSPDYIRTMTHNREIPFYKPNGKKLYFKKEEIDEWIEGSRIATAEEVRREAKLYRKRG